MVRLGWTGGVVGKICCAVFWRWGGVGRAGTLKLRESGELVARKRERVDVDVDVDVSSGGERRAALLASI